jgi:lipopolysaccharide export system protein LptA
MPMNTNRKSLLRNVLLTVAGLAAIPVSVIAVRSFLATDPFAAFRSASTAPPVTKKVALNDVSMKHFRGGKLITEAQAKEVEIGNSRNEFKLRDVSNGVYNSEKGPIQFAAKNAIINAPQKSVLISDGAAVKHKDFDLTTREIKFTNSNSILETKQPIEGKLYGGDVKAIGFRYNTRKQTFVVGKSKWQGNLALNLQDGGDAQRPTRWNIEGDNTRNNPKTNEMITDNGRATDGEIIIYGDKIVWNRKDDVVTATGNVRYYGPEANMTAAKVVVYRKEKRAVLTDKVRMLVKPAADQDKPVKEEAIPEFKLLVADKVNAELLSAYPKTAEEKKHIDELRSSDSMKKYPTQMAADYIEYWYGKGNRHATVKGNPQARQDFTSGMWRHIWTDHALYDGEKDLLTLISGDKDLARMKNSYGDDGTAKTFIVSTKEDDEEFSGTQMKGVFMSTEPDEREQKKTPPPVTTGGGGSAGKA